MENSIEKMNFIGDFNHSLFVVSPGQEIFPRVYPVEESCQVV